MNRKKKQEKPDALKKTPVDITAEVTGAVW